MLYVNSYLNICDNSGITQIKCFNILKKSFKSKGTIGDMLIGSIKKLSRNYKSKKLKKGDIVKVIIVSINETLTRNSIKIKNNKSFGIILNNQLLPLGTRIYGMVFLELRLKKHYRILTLSIFIF